MKKTDRNKVKEFIRVDHAGERGAVKIYEGQLLALNTLVKDDDLKKTIETHSLMANSIRVRDYTLEERNIYGRIFDLSGNVASPYQFFLTDNINNIISGFVYFNIKPNYDSILPAINYIENDIIKLIESFNWNNNAK